MIQQFKKTNQYIILNNIKHKLMKINYKINKILNFTEMKKLMIYYRKKKKILKKLKNK